MLGAPAEVTQESKPSRPSTLARRRKSESLVTLSATRDDDPSPDLLTLTNVMHGYLLSRNPQTVTTSLRLLATILRLWHDFVSTTLFKVQPLGAAGRKRTLETHEQNLEILYSLAEDILDDDGLETYYESHLRDAQVLVETHPCCAGQLVPSDVDALDVLFTSKSSNTFQQRRIVQNDPLLVCLLSLLDDFLVNDIEVNLSLSETLAALASCSDIRLESWLLQSTANDPHTIPGADERDDAEHPAMNDSISERTSIVLSPVFNRLDSLVKRIETLRQDIQDFDIHLAERRHVFKVGEEIDDVADAPSRKSHDQENRTRSSVHNQALVGSIAERLRASSDVSRSSSPRGRQQDHVHDQYAQPKSLVGRLSHLRVSPSPSPSKTLERTYSPSPLRRDSLSSTTSSGLPSPRGPPDALYRKIRLKVQIGSRRPIRESTESEASSIRRETFKSEAESAEETKEISLSHVLTNIIILQEFILELAAIIQIRASLFGEVSFH